MSKQYGNDNPLFTLYQDKSGKWGLIDGDGNKLPAMFSKDGNHFSCAPGEIVIFDKEEGFVLQSFICID